MTLTSRVGSAILIAVCSMMAAGSARAQFGVELGATIGAYSPMGNFDETSVHSMALPNGPADLGGVALGGELRLWVAPRIGLSFAGSTISSGVGGGSTPNGYFPATHARVSTGAAQLLFRVTGNGGRARAWVSAGGGLVKHGGAAYEQFGTPTNFAGVLGVGSAIRITHGLNAELGITTMLYDLNIPSAAVPHEPGVSERGMQTDFLLHTGLSYTIH